MIRPEPDKAFADWLIGVEDTRERQSGVADEVLADPQLGGAVVGLVPLLARFVGITEPADLGQRLVDPKGTISAPQRITGTQGIA